MAELFTGDDNSVDWGDLQYVVFTLVTLAYFVIQFLAQPANGLPPVPAALLTLTGVSATGYAANKIVSSKVDLTDAPQELATAQNPGEPRPAAGATATATAEAPQASAR